MTGRPTLVLLPGLLCDDRLWKPQVETLSDVADVSIVDLTRDETMSDMVARALDCAPENFALAGLSMRG
jgi:hypothetical protein